MPSTSTIIIATLVKMAIAGTVNAQQISAGGVFRTDYLPVGSVRTDAIISQDCLSDHVHTFYGPQLLRPETTYDDLIASTPEQNSGNVVDNKSLYWHPAVYEVIDGVYHLVNSSDTTAYYTWENDFSLREDENGNEFVPAKVRAFPNGFRMIGGLAGQGPSNVFAGCAGAFDCTKGANNCNSPNTDLFPTNGCEELEVEMSFPSCWDGENLDSPDHISHVAYTADGTAGDTCPSTHPVRIPQISLFFRIFNYQGGYYTFSDDTNIFHADYISGWDETVLQNVLDNCEESTFETPSQDSCRDFLTYRTTSLADLAQTPGADGDPFPLLLQELQALQPSPPLDTQGTIAPETISGITTLPRTTCNGQLLPLNGDDGGNDEQPPVTESPPEDDAPPPIATDPPTVAPTDSPTDPPTAPPTPTPTTEDPAPMDCDWDDCIEFEETCEDQVVTECVEREEICYANCVSEFDDDEDDLDDCFDFCDNELDECLHDQGFPICEDDFELCLDFCGLI